MPKILIKDINGVFSVDKSTGICSSIKQLAIILNTKYREKVAYKSNVWIYHMVIQLSFLIY